MITNRLGIILPQNKRLSSFALYFFIAFHCIIQAQLFSQDEYYIHQYEDRLEGIIKETKLVSGEQLTLLSAVIENKETLASPFPPCYQLAFFLDKPASLNVDVKASNHSYLMHPLREDYNQELNIFSWPSIIPLHFGISINALSVVAELYTDEPNTVVPVVLYANNPVIESLKYNFCFHTTNTIDVLFYRIYHANSQRLVYEGQLSDLDFDQLFYIHWSGCDMQKNAQHSGWYYLNIEAIISNQIVTLQYKFYHHHDLPALRSLRQLSCNP